MKKKNFFGGNVLLLLTDLMVCEIQHVLFPSLHVALFPGGEEEAMPGGPCSSHSEDLQGLEMSQPLLAAEKEPDRGGIMVPPIRGETAFQTAAMATDT